MKITIKKENDKFYLEIEKPHNNTPYDFHDETYKAMNLIRKNIERYENTSKYYSDQYLDILYNLFAIRQYFEDNENVKLIRIPYMRKYPRKSIDRKSFRKSTYKYRLSDDFINNELIVKKRG